MPNYDGLYELRIFYDTTPTGENPMAHAMTVDVNLFGVPTIGTPFGSIDTRLRDNTLSDLQTDTDALMVLIVPFFHSSTNFLRAELWMYGAEPSSDAVFVSAYPLSLIGTSATATVAASQRTITFRTEGGGIMRVQFMEGVILDNVKDPYPFSRAEADALADYLLGNTTPFVGRDNTYPISGNYDSRTQNEKLYKKRYR